METLQTQPIRNNKGEAIAWAAFCCLWVGAVSYASLVPPSGVPKLSFLSIPHADKLIHFCMYAGLSYILFQASYSLSARIPVLALVAVSIAYGGAMELCQWLWVPGRSAEVPDLAANALGAGTLYITRFVSLGGISIWLRRFFCRASAK
jgi:hypothetical protein